MELIKFADPVLHTQCQYFDFKTPPFDPLEFSQKLVGFMYENNGIGLAANQIGVPYSVFCMRAHPENFVCFNPKVVQFSNQTIVLEEACLSYPRLLIKIKRPQHIRVRFNTPNGDTLTKQFTGLAARMFLHEMEHIQGKIFYSSANFYHKEQALKKWRKSTR